MAIQITGGERKRQDAPPVEPDAGIAGREVEPQGYVLLGMDWTKSKFKWILAFRFYWIWIKLDMDIYRFR